MSQPLTQAATSLYPLRCPGKKGDEGVVEKGTRKAATGTPAKWEGYYARIRATKRKSKGWRRGIVIQELGDDLLRVSQKEVAVMAKMTPSEAIVETLLAEGVDQLSGIVGSTFMDMLDLFPTRGYPLYSGSSRAERDSIRGPGTLYGVVAHAAEGTGFGHGYTLDRRPGV